MMTSLGFVPSPRHAAADSDPSEAWGRLLVHMLQAGSLQQTLAAVESRPRPGTDDRALIMAMAMLLDDEQRVRRQADAITKGLAPSGVTLLTEAALASADPKRWFPFVRDVFRRWPYLFCDRIDAYQKLCAQCDAPLGLDADFLARFSNGSKGPIPNHVLLHAWNPEPLRKSLESVDQLPGPRFRFEMMLNNALPGLRDAKNSDDLTAALGFLVTQHAHFRHVREWLAKGAWSDASKTRAFVFSLLDGSAGVSVPWLLDARPINGRPLRSVAGLIWDLAESGGWAEQLRSLCVGRSRVVLSAEASNATKADLWSWVEFVGQAHSAPKTFRARLRKLISAPYWRIGFDTPGVRGDAPAALVRSGLIDACLAAGLTDDALAVSRCRTRFSLTDRWEFSEALDHLMRVAKHKGTPERRRALLELLKDSGVEERDLSDLVRSGCIDTEDVRAVNQDLLRASPKSRRLGQLLLDRFPSRQRLALAPQAADAEGIQLVWQVHGESVEQDTRATGDGCSITFSPPSDAKDLSGAKLIIETSTDRRSWKRTATFAMTDPPSDTGLYSGRLPTPERMIWCRGRITQGGADPLISTPFAIAPHKRHRLANTGFSFGRNGSRRITWTEHDLNSQILISSWLNASTQASLRIEGRGPGGLSLTWSAPKHGRTFKQRLVTLHDDSSNQPPSTYSGLMNTYQCAWPRLYLRGLEFESSATTAEQLPDCVWQLL